VLTVKKVDVFKFDEVTEPDNTATTLLATIRQPFVAKFLLLSNNNHLSNIHRSTNADIFTENLEKRQKNPKC